MSANSLRDLHAMVEAMNRLANGSLCGLDILGRSQGSRPDYPVFHRAVDFMRDDLAARGFGPPRWSIEAALLVGLLGPSAEPLKLEGRDHKPVLLLCRTNASANMDKFAHHVAALSRLIRTLRSCKQSQGAGAVDLGLAYALGWRQEQSLGKDRQWRAPWANAVVAVSRAMVRSPYGPVKGAHRVLRSWVRGYRECVDPDELIYDACEIVMTLSRPLAVPVEASGPEALKIIPSTEHVEIRVGGPAVPGFKAVLKSGEKVVFTACTPFTLCANPPRRSGSLMVRADDRVVISARERQIVITAETPPSRGGAARARSQRIRNAERIVAGGRVVVRPWRCRCGHRACEENHRISGYDPKHTFWSFLSNAVRGPVTSKEHGLGLQQGAFTSGMYYPILASRVGLVQRLIAVRRCSQEGCQGTGTDRCDACRAPLKPLAEVTTRRLLVLRNDLYLDAFRLRSYWSCKSCGHHAEMEQHVLCRNCGQSLFDISALAKAEMWSVLECLLPRRAVSLLRQAQGTGLEALGPEVPTLAGLRAALERVERCPHCATRRTDLEVCPRCHGALSRRTTQLWAYERERHVRSADASEWQ